MSSSDKKKGSKTAKGTNFHWLCSPHQTLPATNSLQSGGRNRRNASADYTQAADNAHIKWHQRGNWCHISLLCVTLASTVHLPSPSGRSRKILHCKIFPSTDCHTPWLLMYCVRTLLSRTSAFFTRDHVVASFALWAIPGACWWPLMVHDFDALVTYVFFVLGLIFLFFFSLVACVLFVLCANNQLIIKMNNDLQISNHQVVSIMC